MIWILKIV